MYSKKGLILSSKLKARSSTNISEERKQAYEQPLKKRKLSNSLKEKKTPFCSPENSEVSSNEDTLTIAVEVKKKRKKKPGLTIKDVPQDLQDIMKISGIDDILEEKAQKSKLSATLVKNILKQVLNNPDVTSFTRNLIDGTDESPTTFEPKYTRAKTRELLRQHIKETGGDIENHVLLNSSGSALPYPESNTLASKEFPEEDSGDDYNPATDAADKSEDESSLGTPHHNTPRTPSQSLLQGTPSTGGCPNGSRTTPSFALPSEIQQQFGRVAQRTLDFTNCDEAIPDISSRTRSKHPMSNTPLEYVQLHFRQLPVKNDKFTKTVFDSNYSEFMKELPAVIPENLATADDDETSDPDFNVMSQPPIRKIDLHEEIRDDKAVHVSKKEYSDMMTEYLDGIQHDLYDLNDSDSSTTSKLIFKEPTIETEFFNSTNSLNRCDTPRCDSVNSSVQPNNYETPMNTTHLEKNNSSEENCNPGTEPIMSTKLPPTMPILVNFMIPRLSPYQLNGLKVQMMQHIQLLTNSILLCHKCDYWNFMALSCRKMLNEICANANNSSNASQSIFNPWNLRASIDTLAVYDSHQHIDDIYDKKIFRIKRQFTKLMKFVYLNSYAFPFIHLLPKLKYCHDYKYGDPNDMKKADKQYFLPGEDLLLTQALHGLLSTPVKDKKLYRAETFRIKVLTERISKTGIILKSGRAIFDRMRFVRRWPDGTRWDNNPIRRYLKHNIYEPLPLLQRAPDFTPCALKNVPESANLPPLWIMLKAKYWSQNHKQIAEEDTKMIEEDDDEITLPLYMVVYPNTNTSTETPVIDMSQSQKMELVKVPQLGAPSLAEKQIVSNHPDFQPLCAVSESDFSTIHNPACIVESRKKYKPVLADSATILDEACNLANIADKGFEWSQIEIAKTPHKNFSQNVVDGADAVMQSLCQHSDNNSLPDSAQISPSTTSLPAGTNPSKRVKPTPNTSSIGQSDVSGSNLSLGAIVEGLNDMPFLMTTPSKTPHARVSQSIETPVIPCNDTILDTPWKTHENDNSTLNSHHSIPVPTSIYDTPHPTIAQTNHQSTNRLTEKSTDISSLAKPIKEEPRRITRQMAKTSRQLPVESSNSSGEDIHFDTADDSVDRTSDTDIVKHEIDFDESYTTDTVISFPSSEISGDRISLQSNYDSLSGMSKNKKENVPVKTSDFWDRTKATLLPKHASVFKKLKSVFSEFDSCRVSPEILFLNVEKVLSEFPMLVNEFLLFLKPQQAMNISKYKEYCAVVRLKQFLTRLKSHAVKALQIDSLVEPIRVMQKKGMSSKEISKVKRKMAPVLQCPYLLDIFGKCFHPPPSLSDFSQIELEYEATLKSSSCLCQSNSITTKKAS